MKNMTDVEQKAVFAENLQRYIRSYTGDQKQLAFDLGIKPTTFNQWVKGKAMPAVSDIRRVADFFGIGISALVDPHSESLPSVSPMASDGSMTINDQYEQEVILAYRSKDLSGKNMIRGALGLPMLGESSTSGSAGPADLRGEENIA